MIFCLNRRTRSAFPMRNLCTLRLECHQNSDQISDCQSRWPCLMCLIFLNYSVAIYFFQRCDLLIGRILIKSRLLTNINYSYWNKIEVNPRPRVGCLKIRLRPCQDHDWQAMSRPWLTSYVKTMFDKTMLSRPNLLRLCQDHVCQDHACQDHAWQGHLCQGHTYEGLSMIKFDPIWSSLIKFEPIYSILIQFDQVWTCLCLCKFANWYAPT